MSNVLHEAHYDGLLFTLRDDGRAFVQLRREPGADPEYIFGPACRDDEPFVMSQRTFNKLCKQMIKDGECDALLARKQDEDAWRNAKKRHVEALYEVARGVAAEQVAEDASCHVGLCPAERCSRCGPILEARRVIADIEADYQDPRRGKR